MSTTYDFWQNKRTGCVFAIKFRDGVPTRFCGPLTTQQFRAADGRLLRMKLEFFHYGYRFESDPYEYLICD